MTLKEAIENGIYKRDVQINNLNKVIIELLKRIANLEREVEKYERY